MHDIINREVPSNLFNLLSDITSITTLGLPYQIASVYIKKTRLDIQKRAFSRVGAKI